MLIHSLQVYPNRVTHTHTTRTHTYTDTQTHTHTHTTIYTEKELGKCIMRVKYTCLLCVVIKQSWWVSAERDERSGCFTDWSGLEERTEVKRADAELLVACTRSLTVEQRVTHANTPNTNRLLPTYSHRFSVSRSRCMQTQSIRTGRYLFVSLHATPQLRPQPLNHTTQTNNYTVCRCNCKTLKL
jgi:hypothetical protein